MTTELVTVDGEIVDDSPHPVTLFGTDNPTAIVERATALANALADVIRRKRLYKHIGNRDHVLVEGWTLLGSMLGVFAEVEWTRATENGWEARAVARTLGGKVVGAAEAMCTRSERTWKDRDEYALRSMAQTRVVSKALRLPLGYIMELAGYSATPADEIPDDAVNQQPARSAPASAPSPRERLIEAATTHGKGAADLERLAKRVGVPSGQHADDAQIEQIIALIETPEQSNPPSAAPATDPILDAVLAQTGGTVAPEKPDYVVRAEAKAAAAKAAPKGARETPEPVSMGLEA